MGLAYFGAAAAAAQAFGTSTPVWFANAIALVAVLRHPRSTWPAFLALVYAADALAVGLFGQGPAALIALYDLAEILAAALLIQRFIGWDASIFNGPQAVRLALVCVTVPIFSSAAGAATLWWTEGAPFLASWRTWYSASTLGLLIVAPFLQSWSDPQLRAEAARKLTPGNMVLVILFGIVAVFLTEYQSHVPLLFLSFPAVLIMTWACGLLGATTGVLAVSVAALWDTMTGHGPLVNMVLPYTDIGHRAVAVQLFLAALLFSSLPLAVLLARQKDLVVSLRKAGEARTEFLAAMSHEIRTPMTGVLGMIDLLSAEELTPAHRGYMDAMRASGRHLLTVINDILDFSRFETGKLELEQIDFSLPELLERVRSLVHPQAVERGLDLHVELSPHSPVTVRGDPTRLRQVLLNLVGNALKFTEHGGVTVRVTQHALADGEVRTRFEIHDTGVGISAENLGQLFDPFTQADSSITRRYGGTGLGLAICRRLVSAMGGQIGVNSVPGQGSVFYFEIPLQPGDPLRVTKPGSVSVVPVRRCRILVAEDVEINRQLLSTALGKQGHTLVFAKDGAQAVELVQQHAFDLVLMDVQMPVMDGVEATRRIRKLPGRVRNIPILALTANVMAREREHYLGAGMNECLMKPIDWDQLNAAIAQYGSGVDGAPVADEAQAAADPVSGQAGGVSPTPLVDMKVVSALRQVAGSQELGNLMDAAMNSYGDYCNAMLDPVNGPKVVRAEAHKLKGSAGTMGLRGISLLAARIERAADEGEETRHLVLELRQTLSDTHRELVEMGLRTDPGVPAADAGARASDS